MPDVHHILFYDYVPDVAERRGPYREAHLARIRDHGAIIMAGALGDPPTGAAIVFRGSDPVEIESFAQSDPYVEAGLVSGRRIERWKLV
jgi:uncharacterized protein YciI